MKDNIKIWFIIIFLMIASFAVGLFTDDMTNPSKVKSLEMLFSRPDGSLCENPCLLGIQPGKTTIDQAKELLNSHKLTKGETIVSNRYSGRDYLDIALQNNVFRLEVDYEKGLVLEVSLDSSFRRGLGSAGLKINGYAFSWEDTQSKLGIPETITASAGDGGMIFEVVALYRTGWCVYADSDESEILMDFSILPDESIKEIGINCYFYQQME